MIGGRWGYAYDRQFTCSYHCMRAMWRADMEGEYDMPMKKGTKLHRLTDEEKQRIRELREAGMPYSNIAEMISGTTPGSVAAYCAREKIICHDNEPEEETKQEIETDAEINVAEEDEIRIDKARIANVLMDIAQILIEMYRELD